MVKKNDRLIEHSACVLPREHISLSAELIRKSTAMSSFASRRISNLVLMM